jgi:hypothetical protein
MPGQILIPSPLAVNQGDTTVFVSDASGKPAQFGLRYSLEGNPNTKAGNYIMKISFSLVEK